MPGLQARLGRSHAVKHPGDLALMFGRHNEYAEITTDRDDHEDTEFHYTVFDDEEILAEYRSTTQWMQLFRGTLLAFLKQAKNL